MPASTSVRFIFIYRGYIEINGELQPVRFDTFFRGVDPEQYYQCICLNNLNTYNVKGGNILNYYMYNMRLLTKHDPEYVLSANFHSGYYWLNNI